MKEVKEALKKKYIYLEAYRRRKNPKFAGIPEAESEGQEDKRGTLVEFLSNHLGIHHPEEMEFQRIQHLLERRENAIVLLLRILRTKIIENKIQFEVQKLDYPCRNLVI